MSKQRNILLIAGYLRQNKIEVPDELILLITLFHPCSIQFDGNAMNLTMKEKEIITSWFIKIFELETKRNYKLESKLLYDYNVDGKTGHDFHRECDGYTNTFSIVESEFNGHLFGGFLSHELVKTDQNATYADNKAFLFVLRSGFDDTSIEDFEVPKMYQILPGEIEYAYENWNFECNEYGPDFGRSSALVLLEDESNYCYQDDYSTTSFGHPSGNGHVEDTCIHVKESCILSQL